MKRALPLLGLAGIVLLGGGLAFSRQSPPALVAVPTHSATAARISFEPDRQPVLALPGERQERIRSLLNIQRRMHFGDFEWNEEGVTSGPVWIRVDLRNQMISVFRGGHEIGSAVILYGTDGHSTPIGAFPVREKRQDGWSRSYDAPMRYMLRLTDDGVAVHASEVEKGYATHGCIGVPPAFARRLFAAVAPGDLVVIAAESLAHSATRTPESSNIRG